MRGTFFKGVVLGAIVGSLTVVATAAVAGTGVGTVFNLGQSNRVNATSELTGTVNAAQLRVINANAGSTASGISIQTATGRPPLVVSSTAKVSRLNADLLDGLDSSALKVHCPGGMQLGGSLCFDANIRSAAGYQAAMTACSVAGFRLPAAGELVQIFDHTGAPQAEHWTSTFIIESGFRAMAMFESPSRTFGYSEADVNTNIGYRCVADPTN